jgi:putative ABC transport system permease protein
VSAACILSYLAAWRALVEVHTVLAAVGIAAALGIAFGIYPAHRAARLNPIDALRCQ